MKKIIIAFFLSVLLIFCPLTAQSIVYADEIINEQEEMRPGQPEQPIVPETLTEDTVSEYNNQVDEWNEYATNENNKLKEEYETELTNVQTNNQEENKKVEENNQQLEKQKARQDRIDKDSVPQLENYTDDPNNLPSSWTDVSSNPKTISSSKDSENKTYDVINLHVFVDEKSGDTFVGPKFNGDNFILDDSLKEHLVLAEWEGISAGVEDSVEITSIGNLYGNGAYFRRALEGYYNGYWVPTNEVTSNASIMEDGWNNGPLITVSYADGTTDRQEPKNIFSLFVYNFIRYGAEPSTVEVYKPNYLEEPKEPEYLTLLEKLTFTPEVTDENSSNNEPSSDNSKEEPKKEEELKEEEEDKKEEEPKEEESKKEPKEEDKEEESKKEDKEEISIINNNTNEASISNNENPIANIISTNVPSTSIINTGLGNEYTTYTVKPVIDISFDPLEKAETSTLSDKGIPLADPREKEEPKEKWALLNLILTILTILFGIKIPKKDENVEEENENSKEIERHNNILPILIAIGSVLTFIFTENVRLPMGFIDQWSFIMLLLAMGGFAAHLFSKDKKQNKKKEEE